MNANLPVNYEDPDILKTIKNTVAKNVSDTEFKLFLQFCKGMNLNPFKKEVWCIPTRQGAQIMTGINGYLAIANSHKAYDGMEVNTTYDKSGTPIESVCKVFRKDRKYPSIGRARWKEDSLTTPIWKMKPTVMIEKVAKSRAIREAFPQELNGTYTEDEMPIEYSISSKQIQEAEKPKAQEPEVVDVQIKPNDWKLVYDILAQTDRESAKTLYKHHRDELFYDEEDGLFYSKEPIEQLSRFQIEPVIEDIPENKPYSDPALDFIGPND